MSELAYRTKEHAGVNRRSRVWGGARPMSALVAPAPAGRAPTTPAPVTPAPVTPAPAMPALAMPAPVTEAAATEVTAVFQSGIRPLPSTSHPHGTAHLRPAVKVPVRLSLAGLGAVTGSVSVRMIISPATPATPVTHANGDLSVSFSYVDVGAASVPLTLKRAAGSVTADFSCVVAAGSEHLDFDLGGHSYRGRNMDSGDFLVATEVTFQEHGKQAPTVLASSALVRL